VLINQKLTEAVSVDLLKKRSHSTLSAS